MKLTYIKSVVVLLLIFSLLACSVNPTEQADIAPSEILLLEITETTKADIHPTKIATPSPTNPPNSNLIISNSPDNKYTVELALSESPIALSILNNISKEKTQIPISDRNYNKIEDDGPQGFRWSTDNKVLMFVLYREPYPKKGVEDFSCFFAIDIEQAKLLTTHFSSIDPHVWIPDKSGVVTVEYGGLNDIFDYYFPETNCYKVTLDSECEDSEVTIESTPLK
jgi:hypothetical protein